MAKHYTRDEVVERFKKTIESGSPVVIAGAEPVFQENLLKGAEQI